MPNRFQPGCCACEEEDPPACLIFADDYIPSTIEPDWTAHSGTWSIVTAGRLRTSSNGGVIYAKAGPPEARHWTGTIDVSVDGSVIGIIVDVFDATNYVYVKIVWPVTSVSGGSLTIIEVVNGSETVIYGPSVNPTIEDESVHNLNFTICTLEGVNGNPPVIQVSGWSSFAYACLSQLRGSGFGYRADSLGGGYFEGVGFGFGVYHNWRADSGIAGTLLAGKTSCECICQCQNIQESGQIPEIEVSITGMAGTEATSSQQCSLLDGDYIAKCISEFDGDEAAPNVYNGNLYCRWTVLTEAFGGLTGLLIVTLYRGATVNDNYRLEVKIHAGQSEGGTSSVVMLGDRELAFSKPDMSTLVETFTGDDFRDYDVAEYYGICFDGGGDPTPQGSITITGIPVVGC